MADSYVSSFLGTAAVVFTAYAIGSIVKTSMVKHDVDTLRLSERKASVLSIEKRKELFENTIVSQYTLVPNTPEYTRYREVCMDGIYRLKTDEWTSVEIDNIAKTYDLCGWKVK